MFQLFGGQFFEYVFIPCQYICQHKILAIKNQSHLKILFIIYWKKFIPLLNVWGGGGGRGLLITSGHYNSNDDHDIHINIYIYHDDEVEVPTSKRAYSHLTTGKIHQK